MLVLSRKRGESIHIGDNIKLTVINIVGGRVRIGIDAPDDVNILRSGASEREFSRSLNRRVRNYKKDSQNG